MKIRNSIYLALAMAASLPLAGCGGGGAASSGIIAGHGAVNVQINWGAGRIIPDKANFIRLAFRLERKNGSGNWVADPNPPVPDVFIAKPNSQATIEDLPEATDGVRIVLVAETRETQGVAGVILSSASQDVSVVAGQTVSVKMTLASAVKELMVTATAGVTSPNNGYAGVNAGPFSVSPGTMASFRVQATNDETAATVGDGDIVPINLGLVQVEVKGGDIKLKNRTTNQLVDILDGLAATAGVFDVVSTGPNPGTVAISTKPEANGTGLNFTPRSFGTVTTRVDLAAAPPSPISALQTGYTGNVQDVCLFLIGNSGPRAVQALLRNKRAAPPVVEKSRLGKQNDPDNDSILNNYRDVATVEPGVTDAAGNGRLCRETTGNDNRVLAVLKGTTGLYETFTSTKLVAPVAINDLASADGTPALALGTNGRLYEFQRSPSLALVDRGLTMSGQDICTTVAPWDGQSYVYVRSASQVKRFQLGSGSPDPVLGTLATPTVLDIASDGHYLLTLTGSSLELRSWNGTLLSQTPVTGGKRVSASKGTVVVSTADQILRFKIQ